MASTPRSGGSKKGPTKGSGGKNKRGLRGKGPTPKAEDRVYHKAHKAAQNRKATNASAQAKRKKRELGPNMVAGRNSVLEALREGVPATAMYVSGRIDSDDRVRESITLATQRGISMLEASKPDLDRLTDDAIHQGIALQVPPYEYADPSDLLDFAADRAETPLLVALDGITDPRNLGAIVRSTAAFGGHGVIIPNGAQPR
jgi:23S rRNA (guanosine2251-2'-O)-methyltransferase